MAPQYFGVKFRLLRGGRVPAHPSGSLAGATLSPTHRHRPSHVPFVPQTNQALSSLWAWAQAGLSSWWDALFLALRPWLLVFLLLLATCHLLRGAFPGHSHENSPCTHSVTLPGSPLPPSLPAQDHVPLGFACFGSVFLLVLRDRLLTHLCSPNIYLSACGDLVVFSKYLLNK